jgi:plasmid stabilization system protein ParE
VATLVYSATSLDHIERACRQAPGAAAVILSTIQSALTSLATHPLLGRRIDGDLRKLVISYGKTGHVALYRFVVQHDEVRVLALRTQRENQ